MSARRFLASHRSLLVSIAGTLFVVGGTYLAIRWAQGYRPSLKKGGPRITGTGLFVATSTPKGAQVLVNGKLTTATDDTLNFPPGFYDVELRKDGYSPWKKTLAIAAELVTQTNARLFPAVPNLTPLTFTGARDPFPSPNGQTIVYKVEGATPPSKNGLWVVDLANRNLPIARASVPRQIARNNATYNFLDATLVWTPDASQLLSYWETKGTITHATLLTASGMNDDESLRDSTSRLPVLLSQWHEEMDLAERDRLKRLPPEMRAVATSSATRVFFSPDETKVLYEASARHDIPNALLPDLPSESTQKEERTIAPNGVYVYDLKEDRNYRVGELEKPEEKGGSKRGDASGEIDSATYWETRLTNPESAMLTASEERGEGSDERTQSLPPVPEQLVGPALTALSTRYSPVFTLPLQWFPTSVHLLKRTDSSVNIIEYDGANDVTVYAGPFDASFVYPWPDGSKVVILTDLNRSSVQNLYTIALE